MRYRDLGTTGLRISEVGFGSWAIGGKAWGPQDDEDSKAALRQALDLGCNFIDTAWVYGDGHSEQIIGSVLKERGDRSVVATKVPPKNWQWDNKPGVSLSDAFPVEWVVQKCEESLSHLGRDHVEVLQLHTWAREWNTQADDLLGAVARLKQEGKIRAFGLSLRDKGPDEADDLIRARRVDTIQFFFNLLYQEPLTGLVPLAGRCGVGLIARVPLAFGALTGKFTRGTRFQGDDHRRNLYEGERLEEVIKKVERIRSIIPPGMSLPEAAVKWTLSYPEISCAIPGIRNVAQAVENCAAGDGFSWPALSVRRAEALYRSNFGMPVANPAGAGAVHAVFMSGVALSAPRVVKGPGRQRPARSTAGKKPVKTARKPRRKSPRKRKGRK